MFITNQKLFFNNIFPINVIALMNTIIKVSSKMRSKNMADYTDFNGKTNRKIVQPPGGTSTFSLGWGYDTVDYSQQKMGKKTNTWNKPL